MPSNNTTIQVIGTSKDEEMEAAQSTPESSDGKCFQYVESECAADKAPGRGLRPMRLSFGSLINKVLSSYKSDRAVNPHAPVARMRITSKKLGEGGYGTVFVAQMADSANKSKWCAAKVVDLDKTSLRRVLRECDIMASLNHDNIIRIHTHGFVHALPGKESGPRNGLYCIFMELATKGDLFGIVRHGITEAVAQKQFRQIVGAVQHMHARGIVHRDLKLENILCTADGTLKVIDFGLSHHYKIDADGNIVDNRKLRECVGSPSYAAPEVLSRSDYDGFAADLWSLAVILFAMVSGFFPLEQAAEKDWRFPKLVHAQIAKRSSITTIYSWYKRSCDHLSEEVIGLLDVMIFVDPSRRATLPQVLQHPWVYSQ